MNNKFVFIVPAFNAEQTITRSIGSVAFQTYPDWKIIIRDDMSTDSTVARIEDMIKGIPGGEEKITYKSNTEKKWEVANILDMLDECESNDIICRLDADDWLCDCDALTIIDHAYRVHNVDALWTAHRWSYTHRNLSAPLPKDANPYEHEWVSSHLKTFRKRLIEGVDDKNFRGEHGNYFKRIGDQAIYLPVLHQAAGNWRFEPIVAYHYSIDLKPETFHTTDAKFQKTEAEYLRSRGFVK
jgi:glycosyltransferase involved in cell wall biosynthesis